MLKGKLPATFIVLILTHLQIVNCQDDDTGYFTELQFLQQGMGFCSNYFQYIETDGFFSGKLTLWGLDLGDLITLQFYLVGQVTQVDADGIFLPDDSPEEVLSKLDNNQPITFRIDFPILNPEPELVKIFINEQELCSTLFTGHKYTFFMRYPLQIVNNAVQVYTHNINMPHFLKFPNCGIVDDELIFESYVDDDTVLRRGEYPWLSAIYKNQTTGRNFICSGSLVTSELILTAAHCIQGLTAANIIVELGRYNLLDEEEEENMVVQGVKELILHPEYKPVLNFSDADLALLKMQQPVSFTSYITPICLWTETAVESIIVGRIAGIAGWGTDANGKSISDVPKKLKAKIVSNSECARTSSVFTAISSSRTLCAKNQQDTGTCEGDSGGGLIFYRNGLWTLRGVISAGLTTQERCNTQQNTVYCDVAKHTEWLDNYIGYEKPITGAIEDICGKTETTTGSEHPWLAAIYVKAYTGVQFLCTGALISAHNVLASAGCLSLSEGWTATVSTLRIYFGRHDLNSITESGIVTRDLVNLIQHENFKETVNLFFENDIAIMDLATPVSFTHSIKPICLWSEPADRSDVVGQAAILSSWNRFGVYYSNLTVAQSMEVNIVSIEKCQLEGYKVNNSSPFLCTPRFGNNADGILMLKRNGRWQLRGIATANLFHLTGYNFADFRLYTDIVEHLLWIEANKGNNFDITEKDYNYLRRLVFFNRTSQRSK